MSKLQLEELESRQLLNGTGILSQPPPSQPLTAFTHSFMMIERAFFMDYDGHVGAFGWGWFEGERADISLLRITFSPGPGDRDPVPPGQGHQEPGAVSLEIEVGDARVGADHFATRPGAAGGPAAALIGNGAVATAALDPPGSTRGV